MKGFREAAPSSSAWNLGKTLLYSAAIWTLALFVLPSGVVRLEAWIGLPAMPPVPTSVGLAVLVAASLANVTIGVTMARAGKGTPLPLDTARELVVRGPYAHVRNPMAMAGLGQGIGAALLFSSWAVSGYVAAGGVFWQVVVRPMEERDMLARFGSPYDDYRQQVRCWVPRRAPYRADAS